jgi:four helix bundle protein
MEQEDYKNGTFFRFEDLRVYHKALDYVDWVYTNTRLFPDDNTSLLAERFIKSSQAIALFIAEGSARNKNQFVHYLKMAKSAVRECVVITTVAEKQNLLSEMLILQSRNELMELTKMIGALIGSLQKPGTKGRSKNRYDDDDVNYQPEPEDELISTDSIDIKKY